MPGFDGEGKAPTGRLVVFPRAPKMLVEKVVDEAIAATCAEACGVLRKLHEGTLDYAFGSTDHHLARYEFLSFGQAD